MHTGLQVVAAAKWQDGGDPPEVEDPLAPVPEADGTRPALIIVVFRRKREGALQVNVLAVLLAASGC